MITGETLKSVRERLGEKQGPFAERFGVNQATISRWETEGPPQSGVSATLIKRVLADLDALPETAEARAG